MEILLVRVKVSLILNYLSFVSYSAASFSHKHPLEINKMSNKPNALSLIDKTLHDYRIMASKNGRSSISNGSVNSSTSDRWTRLSVSNDNSSSNGSEGLF